MPLKIAVTMVRSYKKRKTMNDAQAKFVLRVATLAYKIFPDLDTSGAELFMIPTGIEFRTDNFSVRAFYFKNENMAYVYQYEFNQKDSWWEENPKPFDQFTDKEIISVLKRKRFPKQKIPTTS